MKSKVLCMCFGNACRSPMMEAILRYFLKNSGSYVKGSVRVESAGINPNNVGQCATDKSVVCMNRLGIDITSHRSRCIDNLTNLHEFDLFICAEESMAQVLRNRGVKGEIVVLGISNPYPSPEQSRYDQCCADIFASMYRDVIAVHFNW